MSNLNWRNFRPARHQLSPSSLQRGAHISLNALDKHCVCRHKKHATHQRRPTIAEVALGWVTKRFALPHQMVGFLVLLVWRPNCTHIPVIYTGCTKKWPPWFADLFVKTNFRKRALTIISLSVRKCTKLSTQWWSGRSTTANIVLDLRSLSWGFGESCTIVRFISSQPANVA